MFKCGNQDLTLSYSQLDFPLFIGSVSELGGSKKLQANFYPYSQHFPEENPLFSLIPVGAQGLTFIGLPWVFIPESFAVIGYV